MPKLSCSHNLEGLFYLVKMTDEFTLFRLFNPYRTKVENRASS